MTEPRIVSDPQIMMGKPVIQGTRITVEHVFRMSAMGCSQAEIVDAHPHLSTSELRAAYEYAADFLRGDWRKRWQAERTELSGS
jgi:uncharacterized protein (DUF433 family)